ncbi:MAG: EamA family transporter [Holophagales bacterium]|nr:EamA family transporter [Holophagales bacterium]
MDHPSATPARPDASSNFILFFLASFIWGTTWLAIKFQLGVVAPEVSVAWRFGLASLLLVGWCLLRGISLRFTARDHARLALLGFLLFGLNYVLVYRAEQHLASGLVAVVFSFLVFWNLIGARFFFGTPAPPAVAVGAVLGVAGVALLFWPEVTSLHAVAGQAGGLWLALVATLFASAGNLYSQRLFATGLAVAPSVAVAMGYASLSVMAWCVVSGVRFSFDARPGACALPRLPRDLRVGRRVHGLPHAPQADRRGAIRLHRCRDSADRDAGVHGVRGIPLVGGARRRHAPRPRRHRARPQGEGAGVPRSRFRHRLTSPRP